MMRKFFERELERLQDEMLMLGSMVSEALNTSVDALKQQDLDVARQIIQNDQRINERRYTIEEDCLTLIATQQPVAGDIRLLAAMLEIVTELERIGDYAKGIGKITLLIGKKPLVKPLVDIPLMCDKVVELLRRALDAFIRRDVDAARAIPDEDDVIDDLYNKVQSEIVAIIAQNPAATDQASHLLWAAHNLERAGDRITNICERIIFTVTGEMIEMDMEETID